jgi:hypothetical protein
VYYEASDCTGTPVVLETWPPTQYLFVVGAAQPWAVTSTPTSTTKSIVYDSASAGTCTDFSANTNTVLGDEARVVGTVPPSAPAPVTIG